MSVTQGCPKSVTDDMFAQIFAPHANAGKQSDVLSTLSRTIDDLEQPMQGLSISSRHAVNDANGHMHKIDVRNSDGSESSMYVQLNAMSGQFLPFRPPPAPTPASAVPAETGATESQEATEAGPQRRVYKAIFTLEETTEPDGEVRILAHSPILINEHTTPRTFLERMALRQLRRDEAHGRPDDMLAISVKRQRKLKMKKKKYKKLMKRTRNERRKLDRV
jgi:hypothetical protein